MNLLWMETALLFYAENTHNQRILKVRGYNQFSPIMSRSHQCLELKYSNLQELWLRYKYRYNNQEKVLGTNITRNWTIRTTIYYNRERLTTQILKPRHRSSQWAAGDREHRKQKKFDSLIQSCAKAKACFNGFQLASLDIDSSKSGNLKGLWIRRQVYLKRLVFAVWISTRNSRTGQNWVNGYSDNNWIDDMKYRAKPNNVWSDLKHLENMWA